MTPLGQAAGRKNLAKFLGIDMRAGSTGGLMMMMVMMMLVMMVVVMMTLMIINLLHTAAATPQGRRHRPLGCCNR